MIEPVGDERRLSAAVRALQHRGPDGQDHWLDPQRRVGLGHARLAIIDEAGGRQPMTNETGTIQVVFNGEIYNHVELRDRLTRAGHQFRTRSDTEVLVHLYEEKGPQLVDDLVGMFAFALWDTTGQRLLLARDRLGKKPLYLRRSGQGLAFASEIKSLVALTAPPTALDPPAVDYYLTYQYPPPDRSVLAGIETLPPGHWQMWENGQSERRRYWSIPTGRPTFVGTFDDAKIELRRLLIDATRLRLRSDVPIGVLLSGGLDSAVVVGLMRAAGADTIRTFSAHFGDLAPDESPYSQAVSDMHQTEHHRLHVTPPTFDQMEAMLDHWDEPIGDTSMPATWAICELARQHVKVALTGDGGDETLLGYERHGQFAAYCRQRRWLRPLFHWSGLHRLGRWLCPDPRQRSWRRRLRTLTSLWDPPISEAYLRWLAAFSGERKRQLLTEKFRQSLASPDPARDVLVRWMTGHDDVEPVTAASLFDLTSYLPGAVLTKVDRASMAHGLECRSPLLDHRVVEFLCSLPTAWRRHPQHGSKWILRAACADLLPTVVQQRGKQGFGAPIGEWLRRHWAPHLEAACLPPPGLQSWIDAQHVQQLIAEHRQGVEDHTYRLWTLAALVRTVRRWGLAAPTS